MKRYERTREEGWRLHYGNDPHFKAGEAPTADVISYFVKRKPNEPEVSVKSTFVEKVFDYDRTVDVSWLKDRFNKTLQYKRTWYGDKDIYNFVVLQNYLDQCESGGYTRCIISNKEMAMLLPNKK